MCCSELYIYCLERLLKMKELNPHKHFQTKKDYTKWDNFIEQIDSIKLSSRDRRRAVKAIKYLRRLLGENFLAEVIEKGHPILSQCLMNAAPPARHSLIHFAESLQSFETTVNFHTLVNRIRKASEFAEGKTVLETANKFHKEGFIVNFDVKVDVTDYKGNLRTKKPDLQLINNETGEEVYVEVSRLRTSQTQSLISRTYHIIWRVIHNAVWSDPQNTDFANPRHILPYVQIHRGFNDDELLDIVAQIEQLIAKVRETGKYHELIFENMIDIAISPFHDHSQAKEWAARRELTDFVEGPLIEVNEISRVRSSIFRELDQLPRDKPGIIEIWNNENLMFFTCDINAVIAQVADKTANYPHLFGVALNINYGSIKENQYVMELNEHSLVSNPRKDLTTELSLFIRNASSNLTLTDSTKAKFRSAYKLQNW